MRRSERFSLKVLLVTLSMVALFWGGSFSNSLQGASFAGLVSTVTGERVMIILKDGSEVLGELVEETEDSISVKSVFGVTTIDSSRIEEIIRGAEVDRREFLKREKSANRRGSAKAFLDLARWASERGLDSQSRSAYQRALELDPGNEAAKIALGWGQTADGSWKNPAEVKAMVAKGWNLTAGRLTAPSSGSGETDGAEETSGEKASGDIPTPVIPEVSRIPDTVSEKLSPEALKRREKELERRRKNREKFEEKKRREYEGVPWPSRSKIKSRNWLIECNSTPEVARTYQWIMEALSATLSKFFKAKDVRRQKPVVKIYRNHDEFMLKTGMGGGVGGFYQPSSQNVVAYHGTFGRHGDDIHRPCP